MKAEVHIGYWPESEAPHTPNLTVGIDVDDTTHSVSLEDMTQQLAAEAGRQPFQAMFAVGDYLVLRPAPQPDPKKIMLFVEIEGERFYWLHDGATTMTLFHQESGQYFAYIDLDKEPKRAAPDDPTVVGQTLVAYANIKPNGKRQGSVKRYPAEDLGVAVADVEEKIAEWVVKRNESAAECEGRAAMLATYLSNRASTEGQHV